MKMRRKEFKWQARHTNHQEEEGIGRRRVKGGEYSYFLLFSSQKNSLQMFL